MRRFESFFRFVLFSLFLFLFLVDRLVESIGREEEGPSFRHDWFMVDVCGPFG